MSGADLTSGGREPLQPLSPEISRQSRVTISILTHNRRETLKSGLRQLHGLLAGDVDVQVVDNGSSDGTDSMVQDEFPWARLIRNPSNMGAAGRNRGVANANGEIVITLDDDVTGLSMADVEWIRNRFQREPRIGALCFKVVHYRTGQLTNWCHHRKPEADADSSFLTYEISEGAVAFRRHAFIAAGGYPESFFISHEGLELAYRLMNAGFEVHYDGRVSVRHSHDPGSRSTWRRYYFDTRNMIWVAVRNMPWPYATRYLFVGLVSTAYYSLRDGFLPHWLRAVRDGLHDLAQHRRERVQWSSRTAALCAEVDRLRPGFWYMVKKRLLRRGMSL